MKPSCQSIRHTHVSQHGWTNEHLTQTEMTGRKIISRRTFRFSASRSPFSEGKSSCDYAKGDIYSRGWNSTCHILGISKDQDSWRWLDFRLYHITFAKGTGYKGVQHVWCRYCAWSKHAGEPTWAKRKFSFRLYLPALVMKLDIWQDCEYREKSFDMMWWTWQSKW